MKEKLLALWSHARTYWAGLSGPRRIAMLLLAGVVLSSVIALSWTTSQTHYAYLFTELNTDDAAAITAKLKELKAPYRVDATGGAVQVPEDRVHDLRLQLAGLGLPRGGGVGFELFDKSQFGATEFEQHINQRRALEGELARTISSIAAVQSARVHLVIPESSVFALHREQSSASVMLRLRPNRQFSKAEVGAVVHLVTAAVPGLSAERVSVVSADGLTLHRPRSDTSGGVGGADDILVEREHEISSALEQHVIGLLERAVGPGRAEVRIHAELDPAARERTEEHYEPTKTALRSEQKTEEKSSAEGPSVAGVPGAQSNLPDESEAPGADSESGSAARTSWTRNWEVDRVTEKTSVPAGKVSRISVAVLVDGTYTGSAWQPRSKQDLDRFAELVKGAVGFDAARGDVVQIDTVEFAKPAEATAADSKEAVGRRLPWWVYAAAGAGAVVLLAIAVLSMRRGKASNAPAVAAQSLPAGPDTLAINGVAHPIALPRSMSREQATVVRNDAIELAARDPATAAVILREWLNAASTSPAPAQARF